MSDTTASQALRHAALIAAMSPDQRIDALRAVDRGVRRLALAQLRSRYPSASEQELVIRAFVRVHGVKLARTIYGQVPEDAS